MYIYREIIYIIIYTRTYIYINGKKSPLTSLVRDSLQLAPVILTQWVHAMAHGQHQVGKWELGAGTSIGIALCSAVISLQ